MPITLYRALWMAVTPLAALLFASGCETADGGGKSKNLCSDENPCASGVCYDGSCYETCVSEVDCAGDEHCVLAQSEGGEELQICMVPAAGAQTQCACTDPDVTLEPEIGCAEWGDQFQCTAWHSVGGDDTTPFQDGTRLCAEFGTPPCCITIRCP